jgi:hypothetical protein
MANPYKTIGNTAAAVVSVLAIGTALWFNRPVTPINAPRPQDEAEIMTACLERHYAMLRTQEQFTITRAEYVSTVSDTNAPDGFRYVTNSPASVQTNTIGFFPNATFNYSDSIRRAIDPCVTGWYWTERFGQPFVIDNEVALYWGTNRIGYYDCEDNARRMVNNEGYCHWVVPTNTYVTTGAWNPIDATASNYLDTDPTWWTNWVTLATTSMVVTLSYSNEVTTNIASITTNYVATSPDIYAGYYGIYSTSFGDYLTYWLIGELLPSLSGPTPSFYAGDLFFQQAATNWVASSYYIGRWESATTNLPETLYLVADYGPPWDLTTSLGIDYGGMTTNYQIIVHTNYTTNLVIYNPWTDGKKFAFERNGTPYWWSTNSYNDLARPLSLMQWQRRVANADYRAGFKHGGYDLVDGVLGGTVHDAYLQYYPVWPISAYMETFDMFYDIRYMVNFLFSSVQYSVLNDTPFTWTDCAWHPYDPVDTNAFTSGWTGNTSVCNYDQGTFTLEPGQAKTSNWVTSDLFTGITTDWNDVDREANRIVVEWCEFVIARDGVTAPGLPGYQMWTNATDNLMVPKFNIKSTAPSVIYRVQFSALTNYMDHAPAR